MAQYEGPVRLIRDLLDVKSRQLRAWLTPESDNKEGDNKDGDGTLHHAFADGAVEIFQAQDGRTRRGTGEHAEFWIAEDKVILNGGVAQMVDSLKGSTRGRQLTFSSRNDTLQVEGAPAQPAASRIRRN